MNIEKAQQLIDEINYYEDIIEEKNDLLETNANSFNDAAKISDKIKLLDGDSEKIKKAIESYNNLKARRTQLVAEKRTLEAEKAEIERASKNIGKISPKAQKRLEDIDERIAKIVGEIGDKEKAIVGSLDKALEDNKNYFDSILGDQKIKADEKILEEIRKNDVAKVTLQEELQKLNAKCIEEMEKLDNAIAEADAKVQEQSDKLSSMKKEDYASETDYMLDRKEIMAKLSQYTKEYEDAVTNRNQNYYKYQNIIDLIKKSGKIEGLKDIKPSKSDDQTVVKPDDVQPDVKPDDDKSVDQDDENKSKFSGIDVDELLNTYIKNKRQIEILKNKENSIIDGGLTEEEIKELENLEKEQLELKEEIKNRYNLSEELRDLSDEELAELKKQTEEKLLSLEEKDKDLREELEEKITFIDNEMIYRNKKVELKNKIVDMINDPSVTIDNVMDIDLNNPSLNLDDNEKDMINDEKSKLSLLDELGRNKKKEEAKSKFAGKSIDDLLDQYVKNNRDIETLKFKQTSIMDGGLTEEDEKELERLAKEQLEIKEAIENILSLREELGNLSDKQLAGKQRENEEKLKSLGKDDEELKKQIQQSIDDINREFEYRNKLREVKNRMADIIDDDTVTTENVMGVDINSPSYNLDDDQKEYFKDEKLKASLLEQIGKERGKKPVRNGEGFVVTFMNGEFPIEGYTNIQVPNGVTIHGPVIDPVPLNKKGKPKIITANAFAGWVDEDGNDVDLTQPITKDMKLIAKYKFDLDKAIAAGMGAAIGCIAFAADFAIPTPIPVISYIGAAGFGIGSRYYTKNIKNVAQQKAKEDAVKITAFDAIPEELQNEIKEMKRTEKYSTFLKSAAAACTISSTIHTIKWKVASNAAKNAVVTDNTPADVIHNNQGIVGQQPAPQPAPHPTVQPTPQPVAPMQPETTQVLGSFNENNQVFRTAADALSNNGGLSAYKPSFAGKETFEAWFNGVRVPVTEGQSIDSIVQAVGATDPSQVAINVMSADGTPLTWQSLADMVVDGVSKSL